MIEVNRVYVEDEVVGVGDPAVGVGDPAAGVAAAAGYVTGCLNAPSIFCPSMVTEATVPFFTCWRKSE
jgi:hypothetical protein